MEIYSKGKLVKKMKRFFVKKDNSFFVSLRGINIEGEGDTIYVDELYMPLLTVKLEGSMLFIDIAKPDGSFLTIIFSKVFPYVYIGGGNASFNEEDRVR